jgi:chromosome segregation ATPase
MTTKQSICINQRITGCQNIITQKGTIMCESCTEAKKNRKKDNDTDNFSERYAKIEYDNSTYIKEIENLKQQLQLQLDKNKNLEDIVKCLQKDNLQLIEEKNLCEMRCKTLETDIDVLVVEIENCRNNQEISD